MTLNLDRVILHTIMHHSSTATFMRRDFVDGWADGHSRPTLLGRLRGVDLKPVIQVLEKDADMITI